MAHVYQRLTATLSWNIPVSILDRRSPETLRTLALATLASLVATSGAQASNVVIDMSQVQDYNQYQVDLQQYEGLAVQNQPDAPQREGVAGTAVRGAAVGAAAGTVGGVSQAPKPPRRVQGLVSLRPPDATAAIVAKPVLT